MHTLNITFVMSPHMETQFKDWLATNVRPSLDSHLSALKSPLSTFKSPLSARLQKVVEVGGEKPGPDHGLSIALQLDFPDKQTADIWADGNLPGTLGSFMQHFGPNAAYFTTLLESSTFI